MPLEASCTDQPESITTKFNETKPGACIFKIRLFKGVREISQGSALPSLQVTHIHRKLLPLILFFLTEDQIGME